MKEGIFGGAHQAKMYQGALLELGDNVLFKGLKIANWTGTKQNTSSLTPRVLRKKVDSSYSKKHILEKNQLCILSLWIGPRR